MDGNFHSTGEVTMSDVPKILTNDKQDIQSREQDRSFDEIRKSLPDHPLYDMYNPMTLAEYYRLEAEKKREKSLARRLQGKRLDTQFKARLEVLREADPPLWNKIDLCDSHRPCYSEWCPNCGVNGRSPKRRNPPKVIIPWAPKARRTRVRKKPKKETRPRHWRESATYRLSKLFKPFDPTQIRFLTINLKVIPTVGEPKNVADQVKAEMDRCRAELHKFFDKALPDLLIAGNFETVLRMPTEPSVQSVPDRSWMENTEGLPVILLHLHAVIVDLAGTPLETIKEAIKRAYPGRGPNGARQCDLRPVTNVGGVAAYGTKRHTKCEFGEHNKAMCLVTHAVLKQLTKQGTQFSKNKKRAKESAAQKERDRLLE